MLYFHSGWEPRLKAELVPQNGDPPIPITRDVTVIGRREYCDIVLEDPSLSKRHCVLVRTDGLLMVRDLASTNGTKVNGQRVSWAALLPNDRLTIGRYKVRIYLGSDNSPSPSEQTAKQRGVSWTPAQPPPRVASPAPLAVPEPLPNSTPSQVSSLGGFAAPSPAEGMPVLSRPAAPPPPTPHVEATPPYDPANQELILPGDSDDELFMIELEE
jgi:predicted component of type VI protein secretion system